MTQAGDMQPSPSQDMVVVRFRRLSGGSITLQKPLHAVNLALIMKEIEHSEGIPPHLQRVTHCGKAVDEASFFELLGRCKSPVKEIDLLVSMRILGGAFTKVRERGDCFSPDDRSVLLPLFFLVHSSLLPIFLPLEMPPCVAPAEQAHPRQHGSHASPLLQRGEPNRGGGGHFRVLSARGYTYGGWQRTEREREVHPNKQGVRCGGVDDDRRRRPGKLLDT